MSTELEDLVQLNKSHIRPAAELLSRAFQDYPVSKYSFADDLEREKKLPYYFRLSPFRSGSFGDYEVERRIQLRSYRL